MASAKKAAKNAPATDVEVLSKRAGWGKAPRETLHKAERYSRFVRVMKRTLPIVAASLTAVVLVFALVPRDLSRMAMKFTHLGAIENDLSMTHPRLTGTDEQGQPFVVTADTAVQDGLGQHVQLKKVEADITLKDGTWLNIVSDAGLVDNGAHTLDLKGNIGIFSDNGYEAHAPAASVDLKTGIVHGSSHVDAQGPLGTLSADTFEIHRDKKQLFFTGNIHSVFYQTGGSHK